MLLITIFIFISLFMIPTTTTTSTDKPIVWKCAKEKVVDCNPLLKK